MVDFYGSHIAIESRGPFVTIIVTGSPGSALLLNRWQQRQIIDELTAAMRQARESEIEQREPVNATGGTDDGDAD